MIPTINLVGFKRQSINDDEIIVIARFESNDPFDSTKVYSEQKAILLSDAALGPKWDEQDIQDTVSSLFPAVAVRWDVTE